MKTEYKFSSKNYLAIPGYPNPRRVLLSLLTPVDGVVRTVIDELSYYGESTSDGFRTQAGRMTVWEFSESDDEPLKKAIRYLEEQGYTEPEWAKKLKDE